MRKLIVFLFISILTISCQIDDMLPNDGEKLVAVNFDGIKFYEYAYQSNGLIAAEKSKFSYYKYDYNKNQRTVSKEIFTDPRIGSSNSNILQEAWNRSEWVNPLNTEKSGNLVFEYDVDNKLIKSTELIGFSEYDYDDIGRMKIRRMYHEGKISGTREYRYDIVGNVLRDDQYHVLGDGSKILSSTTEYKYDDMRNPFFNLKPDRFPVENINPNNIIRQKYTVYNYPDADSDVSYTYNYNSFGLPTERSDGQSYVYSR
jgi:hypothetical protein